MFVASESKAIRSEIPLFEGSTKAEASRFSKHTSPALLPGVAGSVKGSQADSITAARSSLYASEAEVTLWHDARSSDIQPSEKTDMRGREAVQCNTGLHMKGRKSHKGARVGGCECVRVRVHTRSHMQTKSQGETNSGLVIILFNVAQL